MKEEAKEEKVGSISRCIEGYEETIQILSQIKSFKNESVFENCSVPLKLLHVEEVRENA